VGEAFSWAIGPDGIDDDDLTVIIEPVARREWAQHLSTVNFTNARASLSNTSEGTAVPTRYAHFSSRIRTYAKTHSSFRVKDLLRPGESPKSVYDAIYYLFRMSELKRLALGLYALEDGENLK